MSEAVDTLDKNNIERKESVGEFIQHTREELEKTSFPSSDDVRNTTIIVVLNVIFFAIYLYFIDQIWVYLLEGLTWLVNRIAGL